MYIVQNYTLKWCFNRNLIILTNACEAAHGCLRLIRFKQIDACTVSLPHLSSYISFSWLIEMFNRNIRPLIVSSCMSCIKIQISAFPCLFFGTLVYNSFISSFSVRLQQKSVTLIRNDLNHSMILSVYYMILNPKSSYRSLFIPPLENIVYILLHILRSHARLRSIPIQLSLSVS